MVTVNSLSGTFDFVSSADPGLCMSTVLHLILHAYKIWLITSAMDINSIK
jgi:hypothetical protein